MATKQSRRDCHGLRPRNDDFYMKLIYSQLKNWLPYLTVSPKQLRDDLTMIGHFASGYKEIGDEVIFDLEIRQNRADCLGYYGIARDLSVFYNTKLNIPDVSISPCPVKGKELGVRVESNDVHRLQAVRLSNIKNSDSPDWLKNFLSLHDINSINTLVDLTNYVMLWWGIPCHAFDTAKVSSLTWENKVDTKYSEFTTLDGTNLKLTDNCLLVTDNSNVVSLSFIGGQNSGIELSTTETIIEMAVYNRSRVRSDSRSLKTITEASIRLDKELDTESIPLAFNHLISLIQEHCHGEISSELLDIYPLKPTLPQITFDPTKPAQYAGVEISPEFATDVLTRLGCQKSPLLKGDLEGFVPPSIRKDITLEEDLIEEIIRFHGYNKIPLDQPISSDPIPDITPKILYLIEKIKDDLVAQGYDEVRSWPLVSAPLDKSTAIYTQNSINSEYPVLRQSIIQSLKVQLENYLRYKVPSPKFFEIGKIYYQENGKYIEKYALGMYSQDVDSLRRDVARYVSTDVKITDNYAEVILDDLPKPDSYIPQNISNTAIELTSQIITLDANVSLPLPQDPIKLIEEYSSKIDKNILWSMQITDIFKDKYTFRVSYYNCDDKTAKKIHLSAFNLTNEKYNYIDPKSPTVLAYYDDMYQTEIDAEVINIKNINGITYLILDKTLFFPEGGGQPSDTGTINNIGIQELKYKDEQVLHQVNANVFKVGDKINLKIDWTHRHKYMRIHSAGHLLHEALIKIYPHIKPLKGWHQDEAYLIYDGQINNSDLENIEKEVNKLVEENLPILCDYTDLETLSKDATSVPKNLPLHKKLRRLKIGNFPSMADGGVQVKTTKEIGKIKITKIAFENNQTKIDYVVE